jgi:glycosyltransferase involved in cell wall biosynthesis
LFKKIKEVVVYTNGDSAEISTWSNIPYFLTETLIQKGIQVHRVDLNPTPRWEKLFERGFSIISNLFKQTSFNYYRSFIHYINIRYRVRKAINKYPDADTHIFLTFSFSSAGLTKKPAIQIGDWTYKHYIEYFENRKPDLLERTCMFRESLMIKGSDLVFSLFPASAKQMRNEYSKNNISYNGNVVNTLMQPITNEILPLKTASNSLLFIGSVKYKTGADRLIESFPLLTKKYPDLSIHIIGMKKEDFDELPKNVFCYGYLDKAKADECELYYSLLKNARAFINTTPKWGAFSACIEAMYFYTPVIVTAYDEFVETFGNKIDFGVYCESNDTKQLQKSISEILDQSEYIKLCCNAYSAVKDFTWSNYIDSMVEKIENISH